MSVISVSLTDEQVARLKDEQRRSGAPVSLQVRRALDSVKRTAKPKQPSNERPLFGNEAENA